MKKFFAAALTAAFTMSMAIGSFAAAVPSGAFISQNHAKTASLHSSKYDKTAEGGAWAKEGDNYIYKYAEGAHANSVWLEIDGKWYHFNGGSVMDTGWIQDGGNWYYLNPEEGADCGSMATGWNCIDGTWYYFGESDGFSGILYQNTETPDGFQVNETGAWIEE